MSIMAIFKPTLYGPTYGGQQLTDNESIAKMQIRSENGLMKDGRGKIWALKENHPWFESYFQWVFMLWKP